MTHTERFQKALSASDPTRGLRDAVLKLAEEGCPKREIQTSLENFLLEVRSRADHRNADEDAVLDVLDGVAGWCHKDASL